MAIQTNIVTDADVTINAAYGRITSVSIPSKNHMTFVLSWFVSAESAMPAKVGAYSCVHALDDNCIRQAYLYLKTLPEFANAVDC
jgi:hypothetical protein